ncbi:hypothetical protein ACPPVS_09570 [Cellulomonas sp. McL0617]|uniref:hypothetical protein n=1 Tax=Cellulomonas sp. McL0617 TaxID=3415675 RepID=UPI003CE7C8A1
MSTATPLRTARPRKLRVAHELHELESTNPRLAKVLRWTWARPMPVLIGIGLVVGVLGGLGRTDGDQVLFRAAGVGMLGPGFLDVFANSWLQIGPVYLLLLGVFTVIVRLLQLPDAAVGVAAAAAHGALVAWLTVSAARRAASATGAWARRAEWVVGLSIVVGGFLYTSQTADHPEELLVGLLVVHAAVSAGRSRLVQAALLLVLATGVKQWAPTTGGILLAGRRVRDSLVAITVLGVGIAVLYLPFKLWGDMNTFSLQWPFPDHTWLDRVPGMPGSSDWTQRVVQGLAAGIAGVGVAWRRHGSVLVAVIASVAVRLLLDPLRLSYYWVALAAAMLVWLWSSRSPGVARTRWWFTLLLPCLTFAPLVADTWWWHLETLVAVGLPLYCLAVERSDRRTAAASVPGERDPLGSAA